MEKTNFSERINNVVERRHNMERCYVHKDGVSQRKWYSTLREAKNLHGSALNAAFYKGADGFVAAYDRQTDMAMYALDIARKKTSKWGWLFGGLFTIVAVTNCSNAPPEQKEFYHLKQESKTYSQDGVVYQENSMMEKKIIGKIPDEPQARPGGLEKRLDQYAQK